MADSYVLDASLFGAAFFNEVDSERARMFLANGGHFIAPDLLFVEIASLGAKKVWRGEASEEVAVRAIKTLRQFLSEVAGGLDLAEAALVLATRHRFSTYDALYLALAERRSMAVVTLDLKLVERAKAVGLGALVAVPV